MKYIYPSQSAANLAGVTTAKALSFILLSLFLVISVPGAAQSVPFYPTNTFDNGAGVSIQNITRGSINVVNGQLQTTKNNGNPDTRGYDGYMVITSKQFNLRVGYTYTVSFGARITVNSGSTPGNVQVLRGSTQERAGSSAGVVLGSTVVTNTSTSLSTYSISFTVTQNFDNRFLALRLYETESNNSDLYLDNLSITETCVAPNAPIATGNSRCGAGTVTLSATGAPTTGGSYRWYTASTGGTAIGGATGANFTTEYLYATKTYYVSAVNSTGCESSRVPVTATVNQEMFGQTEFVAQKLEAGKPGTIQLNSILFDRKHAVSIKWQSVTNGVVTELGTTQAPSTSPATFSMASAPATGSYFRAIITPIGSVCYNISSLDVTSEGIIALPVELVSFKAQHHSSGVNLAWATASEKDNSGFEIEVSSDGKTFRKIGFVESKVGTTTIKQQYSFVDTKAASGTRYYRLKQVDFDGQFEYSKIVAISVGAVGTSAVYPTLATTEVTVKLASEGEVEVAVVDITGKRVAQVQNFTERELVLPVQHLKSGTYFVTVVGGQQKETFRFVKN